MTVKIGDRAIYRPRVPYGRQSELFAFVTRVVDADRGVVDLIAFPANSELMHVSNVAPTGGLVQIHCWEPSAEDKRIEELEARIVDLEAQTRLPSEIIEMQATAQHNLHEAMAKRRPGRPRKVDAA